MKYLFFVTIFLTACQPKQPPVFTIAAAANIQFAMQEVVADFEKKHAIKTNLVIGSSGKLTAQIQQGAPYSIFLSADKKYPELLFENGKATNSPQVYALGNLKLWSSKKMIINDLQDLTKHKIKKIAIANPKTAPYGKQAENVLKYYNLWDTIQSKLVFAENIAQTNQYILSGACDVGFTAASTAFARNVDHQGTWLEIDADSYSPIEQGAIITTFGQKNNPEITKQFYDFLFSDSAKTIFAHYGYLTVNG
ncbi:MAG: molybdate transport system substrate-binding protein [Paraglaciecola sp.]|jgi:molybdate transport system substrate-binding protein